LGGFQIAGLNREGNMGMLVPATRLSTRRSAEQTVVAKAFRGELVPQTRRT
jgi:hypothetical protein